MHFQEKADFVENCSIYEFFIFIILKMLICDLKIIFKKIIDLKLFFWVFFLNNLFVSVAAGIGPCICNF